MFSAGWVKFCIECPYGSYCDPLQGRTVPTVGTGVSAHRHAQRWPKSRRGISCAIELSDRADRHRPARGALRLSGSLWPIQVSRNSVCSAAARSGVDARPRCPEQGWSDSVQWSKRSRRRYTLDYQPYKIVVLCRRRISTRIMPPKRTRGIYPLSLRILEPIAMHGMPCDGALRTRSSQHEVQRRERLWRPLTQ